MFGGWVNAFNFMDGINGITVLYSLSALIGFYFVPELFAERHWIRLLMISLLVERLFIEKDIQYLNNKITNLMKNDSLEISGRERRAIATNPKPVFDSLLKRQRTVRQEISTLQSAIEIESLSPLVTLNQVALGAQATLTHFSVSDLGDIKATFVAESVEELNSLRTRFERSNLNDLKVQLDESKLQLDLTASK